jgi:tetratricopeptide (TPR) repeat protein
LNEKDPRVDSELSTSMEPALAPQDPFPAVATFIDRKELIEEFREFFGEDVHRLIVLHGLDGFGKTYLAAKFAAEMRQQFKAVFWLSCMANNASLDILFGKLHSFFEEHGESALRGLWKDPHPDLFQGKVKTLIHALNSNSYLLVFDDFQNWISPGFEKGDTDISKTITSMLCSEHRSKVLLISDKLVPLAPNLPLGTEIERTLKELDTSSSIEFLEATGIKIADESILDRIVAYCGGSPYMMQIYCQLVKRGHRDPKNLLASGEAEANFSALVRAITKDMSEESRSALALLCTLRGPVSRDDVNILEIPFDSAIGPLIDRLLVVDDDQTDKLAVPSLVRNYINKETSTSGSRDNLHRQAAKLYMKMRGSNVPESFEELQPGLEEAFHRFQAGEGDEGTRVIVSVAPFLIDWGYIEMAEQNVAEALNKASDRLLKAECLYFLGSIYDLRGNFSVALMRFNEALELFERPPSADYAGVAKTLFRIGRVKSALSKFSEADEYFKRCITICEEHHREHGKILNGYAGSLLSMAWAIRHHRSFEVQEVLDLYEQSVKLAEDSNDYETLSNGHRQIGLLLWRFLKDKDGAKSHYEQAFEISQKHHLNKEIGSVYSEIGYLFEQWGDYEKAEITTKQAIKVFKALGNSYGLCSAYANVGKALELKTQLEDAAFWYQKSRTLSANVNNAGCEAYVCIQQGRLFEKQSKFAEAKVALLDGKRLCIDNNLAEKLAVIEERLRQLNSKQ